MDECFDKLQKLFSKSFISLYFDESFTSKERFNRQIYRELEKTSKQEIKQLANDFLENGICYPFISQLLEKIKYALKFGIWDIKNRDTIVLIHALSENDTRELVDILSKYPHVIKVYCNVDNNGLVILAKYLATNPSLTKLYIEAMQITNMGEILAPSLASNSTLQTLVIKYPTHVNNQDAIAFAQYLPYNVTLQRLVMVGESKIDDVGGQALLDALSINTSLQSLIIHSISHPLQLQINHKLEENEIQNLPKRMMRALGTLFEPSNDVWIDTQRSPDDRNTAAYELEAARVLTRRMQPYI